MHMVKNYKSSQGFTSIEALVVLVVAIFIVGVGIYGYKHRHQANPTASVSQSTANSSQTGTSESIDQITNAEANSEDSAYSSYDNQVQQSATSDKTSLNSLGGAYNESTL